MADSRTPELVIGLVGPIGVDMDMVSAQVSLALRGIGYTPVDFRLTKLMRQVAVPVEIDDGADPASHYGSRIDYANAVRSKCEDDAALAAIAIAAIQAYRDQENKKQGRTGDGKALPSEMPLEAHAYIVRQLKRAEEVSLLRQVYGRKFVQISVSLDATLRRDRLASKMAAKNASLSSDGARKIADELIARDLNEQTEPNGQRMEEAFHLGDVFVSAKSEEIASRTIKRAIDALFGRNSISPTYDEYGAYMAASAALRSIDTSRQVGAAIFTPHGEVVTLGSNEVPAPGGGTYWTDHTEPHRDFDDGQDANSTQKRRIAFDFLKRLKGAGFIAHPGTAEELFSAAMQTEPVQNSLLMDITEYGRMAHAEMNALLDAARLGRPTRGTTLYCTTFPCHNCAKHIVAAGLCRVVFIEPYPKSHAPGLHGDAISIEEHVEGKVTFEHFIGIAPRRYRDIFEKGKRRRADGTLEPWYEGVPALRIEDRSPFYVFNESAAIYETLEPVAAELSLRVD